MIRDCLTWNEYSLHKQFWSQLNVPLVSIPDFRMRWPAACHVMRTAVWCQPDRRCQLSPKPWNWPGSQFVGMPCQTLTHASGWEALLWITQTSRLQKCSKACFHKVSCGLYHWHSKSKVEDQNKTMFSQQTGKGWGYVRAKFGPFTPVNFLQNFPFESDLQWITYTRHWLIEQVMRPLLPEVWNA